MSSDPMLEHDRQVRENQSRLRATIRPSYDVIVCGAGSAGSVLAARLAEIEGLQVLLLEAGPQDDDQRINDPNAWPSLLKSEFDWGYRTEPNPRADGRSIDYPMGKGFGGGSTINVSTWSRGHKADWDFYAQATEDEAWNHESVSALFDERIEDRSSRDGSTGGVVHIRQAPDPHPFSTCFLDSAESVGLRRHADHNATLMEAAEGGCSLVDETVLNGRRQSIFRAYAYPKMARPNLTVLDHATVTGITFDGLRVTGVGFRWQGREVRVAAALEVVLSLGAVNTPKLLMQSGIGAPDDLRRFDIAVRSALPGVGRNLHDHAAIACVWSAGDKAMPEAPRSQVVAHWRTDPGLAYPDVCATTIGVPFPTPENAAWIAPPDRGWSLVVGVSLASRGTVRLTGKEPDAPVAIQTNWLSDPKDVTAMIAAVDRAREIGNGAALRDFGREEIHPGKRGRAEIEDFIRNGVVSFWHASCTARMGTDEGSVVDGKLAVHGVPGLRIADASVLPRVTIGPTMAPSVVIGERAADIVRQAHDL